MAFTTLKKALDLLEVEGYVIRKVGQGTYAAVPAEHKPIALVALNEMFQLEITERKRAEEAAQESEELYRTLVDNSVLGLGIYSPGETLVVGNQRLSQIIGYTKDEYESPEFDFMDLFLTEDQQLIADNTRKRLSGDDVPRYEVRLITKDKTVKWVEIHNVSVKYRGWGAIQVQLLDVTERKQAEQKQRRLVEENAAMAEIGRIISSSLDINEVYQVFADQVLTLIPFDQLEITVIDQEHEKDEVAYSTAPTAGASGVGELFQLEGSITGKLASSHIGIIVQGMTEDQVAATYPCLKSSIRAGYCSWLVVPLINRDEAIGALFLASSTAQAFKAQDLNLAERIGHQIAGAVANARLYSERIRTEERIRDAGRLASIGELAAGVAHEINNPLTSVLGFSQLLMAEDLPTEVRADLQKVYSNAQRAAKIVQNLLSFATKRDFRKEYLNVAPILERALEIKSYDLTTSNVRVTQELSPDLLPTMVDEHQLIQVVLNLLTNAEQALRVSNRKGQVLVRATSSETMIKISILDDGPGIPPKLLRKVFEPFFTTRGVGEGTGLGLSICYGIVLQHDGNMWAESVPGEGATFHIELPIVGPEVGGDLQPPGHRPQQNAGATKHLLVVDDEPHIRDLLVRSLDLEKYTVDLAKEGLEAWRKLEARRYDCILLDLKMPGMSGQELFQHIEASDRELAKRVIFITGDTISPITRNFLSATENLVLSKPLDIELLGRQVGELLLGANGPA